MALNPFKRRFQTPGYAGDTLEDQIAREALLSAQTPNDQILTPQNQEAITRPRTVTPSFKEAFNRRSPEPTFEGKPILAEQVNGEPFGTRDRRTQARDYVADTAQYLRDLQNQPRNWKDKTLDVVDAVSAGLGNKPRTTMSKRERELARAQSQLGMEIGLEKQAQNDLVPVTLDNGQTVMAPARSAAGIASRQQEISQRGGKLKAQKERWAGLSRTERRRQMTAEYKAGLWNNDPEALQYVADELDIPGTLLPAFIGGQMRDAIDDEGNIIEVNRQTGEVTPTGEKSFETVKEAGRNRRVTMTQEGQDRRKAMTPSRTGRTQGTDKTAQRRAANLIGQIDRARREITLADEALARNPNDQNAQKSRREAQSVGEQAASELNALGVGYEAGPGEKGYPYYKQTESSQGQGGQYAGRRISQSKVPEFARRHGMTPEQAVQFLKDQKAIIY